MVARLLAGLPLKLLVAAMGPRLDAAAAAQAADYIRREAGDRPLLLALHRKDIPDWCENILERGAAGEERRRD